MLHFLNFGASPDKSENDQKNKTRLTNYIEIGAGGLSKAMPKQTYKLTQQIVKQSDLGPETIDISS